MHEIICFAIQKHASEDGWVRSANDGFRFFLAFSRFLWVSVRFSCWRLFLESLELQIACEFL